MLFSVVTPVLNAVESLPRCVRSVQGQDGVDVEHLVQDGGSTDGSVQWLRAETRVVMETGADGGLYDAIGRGWAKARGDVLSWLNADEQYLPGTLRHVGDFLAGHPDVDAVFGNAIIVRPDGAPLAARREIPLRAAYVRNGFLYALSCTLFFRRRLWDAGLLGFDPRYRYAGDMDLILRLLDRHLHIVHLDAYLSLFTVNGRNLSTHSGMARETLAVGLAHGAFRSPLLRRLVMAARHVERGLARCYRRETVAYRYAITESPGYREVPPTEVGGRFTYAWAQTQLDGQT